MNICGWENWSTNEKIISRNSTDPLLPLAFSGIHVIDPVVFKYFGDEDYFSLTDFYLKNASNFKIQGKNL